jgi:hypothetical protein
MFGIRSILGIATSTRSIDRYISMTRSQTFYGQEITRQSQQSVVASAQFYDSSRFSSIRLMHTLFTAASLNEAQTLGNKKSMASRHYSLHRHVMSDDENLSLCINYKAWFHANNSSHHHPVAVDAANTVLLGFTGRQGNVRFCGLVWLRVI